VFCCASCFGDSFLDKHIPIISKQSGVCDFCSSKAIPLVEPFALLDYLQSVCSIYVEDDGEAAKPLVGWFQVDWHIFTELDPIKAQTLLGEILNDGEVVRKKHMPRDIATFAAVEKWASFSDEIKWKNRFFFRHELDLDRLKSLFDNYLETDASEFHNCLYRARIQSDESEIPLDKMGKPQAIHAKNGRANPVGIPYLYAASTAETAIAENRPHPGDLVSVARFEVAAPLRLLNLQHPRKTISPFAVEERILSSLRYDLDFLSHLGSELARPILPRVADLEYLPTQYLCEFIKNCGYDGVVFMSSIGSGANIALFDDSKVRAVELTQYELTSVRYDVIRH
jgi:RES domain